MPDPAHNPYTSAVPLPLRQHLTALLPGMNALLHTQIGSCVSPKGHQQLKDWVPCFLRMPVVQAVLRVCAPTCLLLPVYYCLSTTACLLLPVYYCLLLGRYAPVLLHMYGLQCTAHACHTLRVFAAVRCFDIVCNTLYYPCKVKDGDIVCCGM